MSSSQAASGRLAPRRRRREFLRQKGRGMNKRHPLMINRTDPPLAKGAHVLKKEMGASPEPRQPKGRTGTQERAYRHQIRTGATAQSVQIVTESRGVILLVLTSVALFDVCATPSSSFC